MSRKLDWWRIPPKFWASLTNTGVTPAALVKQAGLPDDVYLDPTVLISTADGFRLWKGIETLTADPIIGLRLLQSANEHGRDATFLAALHAPTYRHALTNMIRFKRFYTPIELQCREAAGLCFITRSWSTTGDHEPDVSVDYSLAEIVGIGRIGTGEQVNAQRVEFRRRGPVIPFYEEFFGCRVRYGARRDLIVLQSRDLDRPFLTADADLHAIVTAGLEASIRHRTNARSVSEQVKSELRARIGQADSQVDAISRSLGVSSRTLQRRIEAEGSTFRQLVNTTKHEGALELLAAGHLRIKEIAAQLGFQDTTSFHRAFVTWEGTSPALWAARAGKRQERS
ncbi:AraC family transcriptional regulator [uncultured Sphingomonas sp.]|uniref:AraC family transcriptional regulator n=1 Tax=uncultured Sphingomonas sp. TaxID=158754 RepID=UPI0025FA228C|nr:AraC family transcriptional regulator [uncultured Sphingomonas sp.]